MKSKKSVLITSVIVVIGLIIIFTVINKKKNSNVKVHPKKGSITEAIYGLGTVTSNKNFSFKVGTTKTIQTVYINEGDFVQKGAKLLDLTEGLTVRAPFTGTVISRPFNSGENVFQDLPLITMMDLKDIYVLANIDQQGALRVRQNLPVNLSFENVRNQVFHGKVQSLFPKGTQFVAHIEVENLPPEILPGMTSDVAIEVAKKDNVLLIPVKSILSGQVSAYKKGDLVKIPVKIGLMDEEWAEVLEGDISIDDEVILAR